MALSNRQLQVANFESTLEIYLQYKFLPASYLKNLLDLILKADESLLAYFRQWNREKHNADATYVEMDTLPNLLVDQMITGQSIKMRFSNKKGFSIITKKDDIHY